MRHRGSYDESIFAVKLYDKGVHMDNDVVVYISVILNDSLMEFERSKFSKTNTGLLTTS